MIDVHCHILPFLDDGALDWQAALAMARLSADDGIQQTIATPHWTGARGEPESAAARLEELRVRLADAAIPLKLHAGNEVILVPKLAEALRAGEAATLGGSNYVLLETAQLEHGAYVHSALFQLQSHGYRIILAHPERVTTWHRGLDELCELIERGCRVQVNAGSLLGSFGKAVRQTAEELVRRGWASLLASDGHSPQARPPLLREALERCAALSSPEAARVLVEDNPARILCSEELPYIDTEKPQPRRGFAFPWRR